MDIHYWPDLVTLQGAYPEGRFVYTSKKAPKSYLAMAFQAGDFIVFGKETKGLPDALIEANPELALRIPILGRVRSLNLSTSAGIVLYEALRQTGALEGA